MAYPYGRREALESPSWRSFRRGQIAGATGGSATSVEVNTDPSCSDPGFEPQVIATQPR